MSIDIWVERSFWIRLSKALYRVDCGRPEMFDITIHQIVTESSCSDFRGLVGCQSMTMQSRHITMLRVRARNRERDGREVRQPKLRVTGSNQKRYYFFFKRLAGWFLCSPRSILEWLVTYTYVENVGIIIWWRSIQGCARKISASGFCSCDSCTYAEEQSLTISELSPLHSAF